LDEAYDSMRQTKCSIFISRAMLNSELQKQTQDVSENNRQGERNALGCFFGGSRDGTAIGRIRYRMGRPIAHEERVAEQEPRFCTALCTCSGLWPRSRLHRGKSGRSLVSARCVRFRVSAHPHPSPISRVSLAGPSPLRDVRFFYRFWYTRFSSFLFFNGLYWLVFFVIFFKAVFCFFPFRFLFFYLLFIFSFSFRFLFLLFYFKISKISIFISFQFEQIQIWTNLSLNKFKFEQCRAWTKLNLNKLELEQIRVWTNSSLNKFEFKQIRVQTYLKQNRV
jgi:hypothetical protein